MFSLFTTREEVDEMNIGAYHALYHQPGIVERGSKVLEEERDIF